MSSAEIMKPVQERDDLLLELAVMNAKMREMKRLLIRWCNDALSVEQVRELEDETIKTIAAEKELK